MDVRTLKWPDRIAVYAGIAILIAGIFVFSINIYVRQAEQRELLSQIRNLDASSLRIVELIPKHEPQAVEVCLSIRNSVALKELAAFFSRTDDTDYGGHQSPLFRFKLRLGFIDGTEGVYLIRTYERFPNDIFLNEYWYDIREDGSYSYSIVPQVRIPGLDSWLRERVAEAGCPIE